MAWIIFIVLAVIGMSCIGITLHYKKVSDNLDNYLLKMKKELGFHVVNVSETDLENNLYRNIEIPNFKDKEYFIIQFGRVYLDNDGNYFLLTGRNLKGRLEVVCVRKENIHKVRYCIGSGNILVYIGKRGIFLHEIISTDNIPENIKLWRGLI